LQTQTFIVGIRGRSTGINNAIPVLIDSGGQLGTQNSSRRFKKEIKPMDQTSQAILSLKPVTFHYKSDSANRPEFGLIAEEVAEVDAMLLNEFLKEHKAFVEEQREVEQQQKEIDALKTELKEQRALIEKVSERVDLNRSTSQVVANNQ
jgi:predicted RNase H-like nuclease (RuvC/YqgF family)